MKLYSDEEANYLCRDFRDIPFELRPILFDKVLDDNHISQFNPAGKKKRDYSTPANINLFSEAVGDNYGIDSKYYRKEYNKIYDGNVKNKYNKVMEDRKRDDEISRLENVLANLRKPNDKINDLTELAEVDFSSMYSESILNDMNGNVIDLGKHFASDAMGEAINEISRISELKAFVSDAMDSGTNTISRMSERKALRGVDTSHVHNPSKASQAAVLSWENRRRGEMEREAAAAEALNARPISPRRFARGN